MQSYDSHPVAVPDAPKQPTHDDEASSALILPEQNYALGSSVPTIGTEDHLNIVQETVSSAYGPHIVKPDFAEAFRAMDAILKIGELNPKIGSRFYITFKDRTRTLVFTGIGPLLSLVDLFTTPVSFHPGRNEAETKVLIGLLQRRLALTPK
jgi:hypothetical protein